MQHPGVSHLMKKFEIRRRGNPRKPQLSRLPLNGLYESTSSRGKIRGKAHQIIERYLQFVDEARLKNDPIGAESFLQHAEHYIRISRGAVRSVVPPTITTDAVSVAKPDPSDQSRAAPQCQSTDLAKADKRDVENSTGGSEGIDALANRRAAAKERLAAVALAHGYSLDDLGLKAGS